MKRHLIIKERNPIAQLLSFLVGAGIIETRKDQRRSVRTGAGRLRLLNLLTGAITGMTAVLWGQGPTLLVERSVLLTWPESEPGYIVVESDSADGPWIPSLQPITQVFGEYRVAVPIREHPQFFQLAQGGQLIEDFSMGSNRAWTLWQEPGKEGVFQTSYPNGTFEIRQSTAESGQAILTPPTWAGNWPRCVDVAISVDILDWEPMVFDAMVGFGSRIDNFTALHGYWPRLRILAHEEGRFWNGAFVGGGWQAVDTTSFVLGPSSSRRVS